MQADAAAMELAQQLKAAQDDVATLSAALDEETVAKQALRTELDAALRAVADAEARAEDFESNARSGSQQVYLLQTKLTEAEEKVASLSSDGEAMTQARDGVAQALATLTAQFEEDKIAHAEQISGLQRQITESQKQHADAQAALQEQLQAAEADAEQERVAGSNVAAEWQAALEAEEARRALRDDILARCALQHPCMSRCSLVHVRRSVALCAHAPPYALRGTATPCCSQRVHHCDDYGHCHSKKLKGKRS